MNLKQLEAFVRVAETKNFSEAARQLYLTQPTVSAHISALEKELDICLFIRSTKEVKLSDAGRELYTYAEKMLAIEREIREHFGTSARKGKRILKIAASTIPSQYLLAGYYGQIPQEISGGTVERCGDGQCGRSGADRFPPGGYRFCRNSSG